MSDAIQAETVEVGRLHDRVWLAKLTKFERLHRDYLAARAAYADPDGPDDDEVKSPLSDKAGRRGTGAAGAAVPRYVGNMGEMGNPRPPRHHRRRGWSLRRKSDHHRPGRHQGRYHPVRAEHGRGVRLRPPSTCTPAAGATRRPFRFRLPSAYRLHFGRRDDTKNSR